MTIVGHGDGTPTLLYSCPFSGSPNPRTRVSGPVTGTSRNRLNLGGLGIGTGTLPHGKSHPVSLDTHDRQTPGTNVPGFPGVDWEVETFLDNRGGRNGGTPPTLPGVPSSFTNSTL